MDSSIKTITSINTINQNKTFLGTKLYSAIYKNVAPVADVDLISYSGDIDLRSQSLLNTDVPNIIYLRKVSGLLLSGNAALTTLLDISGYSNLKRIYCDSTPNSSTKSPLYGDITGLPLENFEVNIGQGFTGNMSTLTTLKTTFVAHAYMISTLIPPIPGLNKLLTSWDWHSSAGGNVTFQTTASIGTISDILGLKTFIMSNCECPTAVVNYILTQLRTGKAAGSALTTVTLTGASMGIPTGAASNADYLALVAAGVTVSIRTS
jgi:hypothetical protein